MKKNLITVVICLIFSTLLPPPIAAETVEVNETNFPDENFRKYIKEKLNTDNNGKSPLPYDASTNTINTDVQNVTIDCRGLNISSLKGVEHFKSIENLSCANNHLLSLSVNSNINYIRFTNIGELNGANPEQTRTVPSQTVNLKDLDSNLDPSKVTILTGATWVDQSNGIIKFDNEATTATYEYNCLSVETIDSNKDKYYMDVKLTLDLKIKLDAEHFPDENFRKCLQTAINNETSNKNAYDSESNTIRVADVTVLNCNDKGIKSLKGTELFPNLGQLYCLNNNLIAVKLHPNAKNIWIAEFGNQIREVGSEASIDLATLDDSFDPNKIVAGSLEGATLSGTTLTFNDHSFEASYTYQPIPDKTMKVEIIRYAEGIDVSAENFPDAEFRRFLQEDAQMKKYYKDGKISLGINKMEIGFFFHDIKDLTGIEKFIHLQTLNINDRQVGASLGKVDLPESLTYLYCSNVCEGMGESETFTIKNLNKLTNLEILNLADNAKLTDLDVSNNTKLKKLSCGSNGEYGRSTALKTLILPSDPSLLEELDCSRSKLPDLDLSKCSGLKFIKVNRSKELSTLLLPSTNIVHKLTCDNCNLSELDLSKCVKLRRLECSNNKLTALDLSKCAELDTLDCGNPLGSFPNDKDYNFNNYGRAQLDLSHNTQLTWLNCMQANVGTLDLSQHQNLVYINCGFNHGAESTEKLVLTLPDAAPNLQTLNCNNNNLTDELKDVGKYTELRILECANNDFSENELKISQNTKLGRLYAYMSKLKKLDVSNNTELYHLTCSSNEISELDVTKNTRLLCLTCGNNKLTILDLSKNVELDTLHAESNQLIALDLTNQKNLFDIKLNDQNRYLGKGRHFNMDRRDSNYDSSNIQDLTSVEISSGFTGDIDITEDDQNFPTSDQPSDLPKIAYRKEAADNSGLTQWLTFDEKTEATYNYRTGGIYNNPPADGGSHSVPKYVTENGINYALMDVKLTREDILTGVSQVKTETTVVRVRAEQGAAIINGAEGLIAVYNTAGTLIATATATEGSDTRISLPAGLYMVVTSTSTAKILVP